MRSQNHKITIYKVMSIQENITRIFDTNLLAEVREFIDSHNRFVVTVHMSPDGDAVGSAVGMTRYLRAKGKQATIVYNDRPGANNSFIPGYSDCLIYDKDIYNPDAHIQEEAIAAIKAADAVISLDYNTLSRLGNLEKEIKNSVAPRLLVDHHLDPNTEEFSVVVSHPELSATCEVVYRLILELGDDALVTREIAEPLYCGMMTDTGQFVYSSERPDVYLIIARLLQTGFNKEELHRQMVLEKENRVRLKGYCLYHKMVVLPKHKAAYFSLNSAELKRFNHQKGDSEGFVNAPLDIEGIVVSAFFREERNFIKISLRSKGNFPVNLLAEKYFNGGGHKNAAGGEFMGSLQRAEALFVKVLPAFDKYL